MAKALEMEFGQSLGFSHFLRLEEHGITYIPDNQQIKAGKLNIIHGHEFGGSFFNPVNAARGLFMRAKASVLAGHNHQTSEHQEGNINEFAEASRRPTGDRVPVDVALLMLARLMVVSCKD